MFELGSSLVVFDCLLLKLSLGLGWISVKLSSTTNVINEIEKFELRSTSKRVRQCKRLDYA
jgi:hypothetical protein